MRILDYLIDNFEFQLTRKDFEGDLTLVLFPIVKKIYAKPEELGNKLGSYLININQNIIKFNIVSGFLNLVIADSFYIEFIESIRDNSRYGHIEPTANSPTLMIEYSSPNTNKPLHLGHIRNNLLGFSISKILEANGYNIIKTQIINDRGIFKKKINSNVVYLPNDFCEESLSIHSKVIFNQKDKLQVLYDYVTCHNVLIHRNDTISKIKTDKHIHPIYHTNNQIWYSQVRQDWAD